MDGTAVVAPPGRKSRIGGLGKEVGLVRRIELEKKGKPCLVLGTDGEDWDAGDEEGDTHEEGVPLPVSRVRPPATRGAPHPLWVRESCTATLERREKNKKREHYEGIIQHRKDT